MEISYFPGIIINFENSKRENSVAEIAAQAEVTIVKLTLDNQHDIAKVNAQKDYDIAELQDGLVELLKHKNFAFST